MKHILLALGLLLAGVAQARPAKSNYLFRNGLNTPVYGELFMAKSEGAGYSSKGLRFGLQLARVMDYASVTGGFVYAGGGSKSRPEYIGPSVDLIIMPAFMVHLALSYGEMNGSVGGLEYTYGDKSVNGRIEYKTTEMAANLLVRIFPDVEVSVGYIKAESEILSDGKSDTNKVHFEERSLDRQLGADLVPEGDSITFGIRGSIL